MKSVPSALAALALAVGSVLVPIGASSAAAQPAASGGVVVIANGWSPPDVGAAAPLAGRLDAVVLYSSSDSLGSVTVAALKRLRPARVVLMGGTAALNDDVDAEVRSAVPGVQVQRLSGTDRIDTAAQAALTAPMVPAGRPVVIANGWSPPDVGAAAPLADALGGSVLLAQKNALGAATVNALGQLAPSRVVIVGGTSALDSGIEQELDSVVPGVPAQRLGGADRTDTAGRGAELAGVPAGSPVVLASGWSPPDVGVAAPLAAAIDGTVLFLYRGSLGEHTAGALRRLAPKQVTVVGDTDAVPAAVQTEIADLLPSATVQRIAGKDRKATAADAARYATGDASVLVAEDKSDGDEVTTSIAAGLHHTCWLRPNGTIACRGADKYGRLEAPLGTFIAISAGQTHNCGLRTDRSITCWGAQSEGLWDNPNAGQADAPTGTFTAVTAGQFHSCGLRTDKTIACWGADNPRSARNVGQSDAPNGTFTAVEAGLLHTCGIRTDRTVVCWGAENYESDGDGPSSPTSAPEGTFSALAAGSSHTCGIRTSGKIACWGNSEDGKTVAPDGSFSAITAGESHTCGLRRDHTVTCWGFNGNGQTDALDGSYSLISAGFASTCGLRADGNIVDCWGLGYLTPPKGSFREVRLGLWHECAWKTGPNINDAVRFCQAAVRHLACAVRSSGGLACWGPAAKLNLGPNNGPPHRLRDVPSGTFAALATPVIPISCALKTSGSAVCWGRANGYKPPFSYTQLAVGKGRSVDVPFGTWHVCGLRTTGSVACWSGLGASEYGGVGLTDAPPGRFSAITSGSDALSCGLHSDQTISCWQVNSYGGALTVLDGVPTGQFKSIATGARNSCAIRIDDSVACWSYSIKNLRDDGGYDPAYVAEGFETPSGHFSSINMESGVACGIRTDQSLACWGPYVGELQHVPAGRFSELALAHTFACGLRTDKTVACWGIDSETLVNVPAGEFSSVSVGFSDACAIGANETVICWGLSSSIVLTNDDGASGDV